MKLVDYESEGFIDYDKLKTIMDVVFISSMETGSTPLDIPDSELATKLMLKTLAAPHHRGQITRKGSYKTTQSPTSVVAQPASAHHGPAYFAGLLCPTFPLDMSAPPPSVTTYFRA